MEAAGYRLPKSPAASTPSESIPPRGWRWRACTLWSASRNICSTSASNPSGRSSVASFYERHRDAASFGNCRRPVAPRSKGWRLPVPRAACCAERHATPGPVTAPVPVLCCSSPEPALRSRSSSLRTISSRICRLMKLCSGPSWKSEAILCRSSSRASLASAWAAPAAAESCSRRLCRRILVTAKAQAIDPPTSTVLCSCSSSSLRPTVQKITHTPTTTSTSRGL